MSLPKFIEGGNTNSGRVGIDVPVGRYSFLHLVIFGDAEASEAADLADLCRIRVERDGRQLQGESARFYHELADLKGGAPTLQNEEGEAQRVLIPIPFAFPGTPNSIDVQSKEELDVYLEFSDTLATVFGSGGAQWELYGIREPGIVESYELVVREQDKQSTGAGRLEDTYNGQNTGAVFIYDDDDVLGQVQIEVDGDTVVDNITFDFLQDLTNSENRVENKRIDLKETSFVKSGNLTEALNANVEASYQFTGAGTVEVTLVQIDRRHSDVEGSRQRVQRFLASKSAATTDRPSATRGMAA